MTKQRLFIGGGGCYSLLIDALHKAVKGGDV